MHSVLELEGVVKHYREAGEEIRAVDGIDLTVAAGQMVALHGPSGSGKTTLLLLIAALLRADRGTLRFKGRDLSTLSPDESSSHLLRDVGFIYQSPQLMARVSAVENAAVKLMMAGLGMREAKARASDWLARVGMGERVNRVPERLSGGERQRVAIARALAGDPPLILADEPTANLDSVKSVEIVELLGSIAHERGAAVLLVTHDPAAAAVADRQLTLRDGKLTEEIDRRQTPIGERGGAAGAGMEGAGVEGT